MVLTNVRRDSGELGQRINHAILVLYNAESALAADDDMNRKYMRSAGYLVPHNGSAGRAGTASSRRGDFGRKIDERYVAAIVAEMGLGSDRPFDRACRGANRLTADPVAPTGRSPDPAGHVKPGFSMSGR